MIQKINNPARDRLEAGELSLGVGIIHSRTVDIAPMMKNCGFDWLFLDMEHGVLSLDDAAQMAMAGLSYGITPIVRVPIGSYGLATRMLDCGALGIVMPHVENKNDAEALVDNTRFPPVGHRGIGGTVPQFGYEQVKLAEAVPELNRSTIITVMVETPEAIARADEIAAVEGVDVVMIGTNDLALAMGHPQEFDHPEVVQAYEAVAAACKKHGKWLGSGGVRIPETAKRYIDMGANFFLAGQDVAFMMIGAKARSDALRGTAG